MEANNAGPESSALTVCSLPLSTGKSYIVTGIILKQPRSQGLSSYRAGCDKMRDPGNEVDSKIVKIPDILTVWFLSGQFFLSKPMYKCFPSTVYQINALLK